MAPCTTSTDRVQMALEALRIHFDEHFDRGWLAMTIDDLPIDSSLVRRIREVLSLTVRYEDDLPEVRYGVEQLRTLLTELRRHLAPVLRDRLGVSGFALPSGRSRDATSRVQRQLLCVAFPHNLSRLEELTDRLDIEVAVAEVAQHSAADRVWFAGANTDC